jgi:fatty acid desaturase
MSDFHALRRQALALGLVCLAVGLWAVSQMTGGYVATGVVALVWFVVLLRWTLHRLEAAEAALEDDLEDRDDVR